jgi:chromate transport protein ChrA
MLVLALFLVPWRHLLLGSAWRESFVRWCQPWFWLLVAVVLTVVGESLYLAVKDSLPKALTVVADKFSITATFSVLKDYKPLSLTASLSGILGLVLGTCLFLAKGVKEALKLPST